ncbi:MAG: hypothetical protein ACC645_13280 [Pirellulales bacterium]
MMNRITVNDALRSQLDGIDQPVEVCDAAGQTLGHFVPTAAYDAFDGCPYSTDQLDRMRGEESGRPLAEIWKSLRAK